MRSADRIVPTATTASPTATLVESHGFSKASAALCVGEDQCAADECRDERQHTEATERCGGEVAASESDRTRCLKALDAPESGWGWSIDVGDRVVRLTSVGPLLDQRRSWIAEQRDVVLGGGERFTHTCEVLTAPNVVRIRMAADDFSARAGRTSLETRSRRGSRRS